MPLFNLYNSIIKNIKEIPFRLEKEIQNLFEINLFEIAGLELVRSEFTVKNRRIDTLAFDRSTNGFVIIEYKRDKNFSVIDQGFMYLSLMLENFAEFILEFNESSLKPLKRTEFEKSQSRVMFVSTGFNDTQIQASNFKDITIELWEVKRYEDNIILVNQIKKTAGAESIKPITEKNSKLKSVTEQIFVPTEEYHLNNKSDEIKELYYSYKNSILGLSTGMDVRPKKQEIGFTKDGKIIADVVVQKNSLKMYINLRAGQLDDPKHISEDVQNKGHWGSGDYCLKISDTKNLEYIMSLVKQSIEIKNI